MGIWKRLYVQQDANWNVTALINTAGNVVERFAYDPYGAVKFFTPTWTEKANSNSGWKHLHQGTRLDSVVGLTDNRDRNGRPDLMRPIQQDPLGLAPDTNAYRWEGNNPVNRLDPSGLWWSVADVVNHGPVGFIADTFLLNFVIISNTAVGTNYSHQPVNAFYQYFQERPEVGGAVGDGSVMVYNVVTFYQDPAAVAYVDQALAQNGGLYYGANASAHIGVGAAYAATGRVCYNIGNNIYTRYLIWRYGAPGAAGGGAGLFHLTSDRGRAGIETSGRIVGNHGIFAVPQNIANQGTLGRAVSTGLWPSNVTQTVPIPPNATDLFTRPMPIGPYSAWKYFGQNYYAPPGYINLGTGTFTSTPSLFGPAASIYGVDAAAYTGGGLVVGAYWYGSSLEKQCECQK